MKVLFRYKTNLTYAIVLESVKFLCDNKNLILCVALRASPFQGGAQYTNFNRAVDGQVGSYVICITCSVFLDSLRVIPGQKDEWTSKRKQNIPDPRRPEGPPSAFKSPRIIFSGIGRKLTDVIRTPVP